MSKIEDRAAWLEARRTGIGGSDAAAVLGLSKWQTPLSVWLDKTGQAEGVEENEPMRWGSLLEPVIRQEYAQRTGREIVMPGLLRHPKHDWMLATPDGVSRDNRLIEIKTARSADGWGEPGSDQVPEDYLIQVQHYMAVTALPVADIAVLIGGSDFRIYTVDADAELHDMLMSAEDAFWRTVIDRTPPEPISYADAMAMYGKRVRKDSAVVASEEVLTALDELKSIRAAIKKEEAEEEARKAVIIKAMGEHDTLIDAAGKVLVTWRMSAPPMRLDGKALAKAHPDIHAAFLKEGEGSRKFLIKGEKEKP